MENNLAEHSGSFARKDESPNAGDTPRSPLPEHDDNIEAKPDTETENATVADIEEGESNEEETSRASLEKVLEDIDQFLGNPQGQKHNDNNNADCNDEASLVIPDFIDRFLDLVEENIARYDKGVAKWGEASQEDSSLLESVNRISNLMRLLSTESQSLEGDEINGEKNWLVNRIGSIQQRTMSYLEEEFRSLMEEQSRNQSIEPGGNPKGKHVAEASDSEPANSVTDFPCFAEEAVTKLNNIAREMISAGYAAECSQVYFFCRRHAFEESVQKIGLEKHSIDEVHKMQWEPLERQMLTWINTFKVCAAENLSGEKKLADSIFSGHPLLAARLFGNLACSVVMQLLNFAESVALTKRVGEKLFKVLDMYETLRDMTPILENMLSEDCFKEIQAETTSAKSRLGEFAIVIFCDLENTIKSDTGKNPVNGGAVHPLTRYIMSYLRSASKYKDTLEEVFREHAKIERRDSPERENENEHQNKKEDATAFGAQLMKVMDLLDKNLEGKGKQYKDVALSCIFMMNNGRHIVQQIKSSSGIYQVMGETWCRKRYSELRSFHKNYQIETWSKILGCLSPKGLSDNGKVPKPVLKERFKSFNALFDEIHKTQSSWVVSDEQLKSELRVSISALVIPAYRSFLGRFSQYLNPGRQTEKYIKYQADDIETYIEELFDGHARKKA